MTRVTSHELSFPWEGLHLAGTLYLPDSPGRHPAVLMMQGSGPTDRDNDGYFSPLRDVFIATGVAVYSFDKPGVGESTGDWRDHALEDRARQSTAALGAMAGHPELDAEKLGVWGHSQGGWLVQMLASRRPDLSFAICNSGPTIGIEEQDLYGCAHTMRAGGHPQDEVERALAFIGALHAEANGGAEYADVERRLLTAARGQPWYGYLTVDDESEWKFLRKVVTERYDPVEALCRIHSPYLAVYGGLDLLVPAWESARVSGDALVVAGNEDATIVIFPRGNHRIQEPDTGRLASGYLDLVTGWAARRVGIDR